MVNYNAAGMRKTPKDEDLELLKTKDFSKFIFAPSFLPHWNTFFLVFQKILKIKVTVKVVLFQKYIYKNYVGNLKN